MVDDLEILSPNKHFGKNCNTKSKSCDNNFINENQCGKENDTDCNNSKPKKSYLKRGTGLARYGLNLQEVKKKAGKLKFHKPVISVPPKIKVPRKCLNQVQTFPKIEFGKLVLV